MKASRCAGCPDFSVVVVVDVVGFFHDFNKKQKSTCLNILHLWHSLNDKLHDRPQ